MTDNEIDSLLHEDETFGQLWMLLMKEIDQQSSRTISTYNNSPYGPSYTHQVQSCVARLAVRAYQLGKENE